MYWRGYELPNNLHILEARGKFSVIVHELAIALATANFPSSWKAFLHLASGKQISKFPLLDDAAQSSLMVLLCPLGTTDVSQGPVLGCFLFTLHTEMISLVSQI